ncbi:MAG: SGNH/GDSL hydrolase family protein [Myxococcales bacterium]|nr:SGNH/GDSL hydrolase family protein [Myxococcales bacterium]
MTPVARHPIPKPPLIARWATLVLALALVFSSACKTPLVSSTSADTTSPADSGLSDGSTLDSSSLVDLAATLDAAPFDDRSTPDDVMTLDALAEDAEADDFESDAEMDGLGADLGDVAPDAGDDRFTVYRPGLRHLPLTPRIKARLRTLYLEGLALGNRPHVFAKIGASLEDVPTYFLGCMGTSKMDLADHDALQPSVDFFAQPIDASNPSENSFNRDSLAAISGWTASDALALRYDNNTKSAIEKELETIKPAFAIVAFGGNDMRDYSWRGDDDVLSFLPRFIEVVELLLAHKTIPILRTLKREDGTGRYVERIHHFNAILYMVAQTYELPMMDLYTAIGDIPTAITSADGIHLTSYSNGGVKTCAFTPAALQYGNNIYNLLALESLDRLRRVIVDDEPPLEPPIPLVGDGSNDAPYRIDQPLFGQANDTSLSPYQSIDAYSCGPQKETGPEWTYRLEIPNDANGQSQTGTLTLTIFEKSPIDVDLQLLASTDPESCLARHNYRITQSVTSGSYVFTVDTFENASGVTHPGPFMITVVFRPN